MSNAERSEFALDEARRSLSSSTQTIVGGTTGVPQLPGPPIEGVNHEVPFNPLNHVIPEQAVQASLYAHSVLSSIYTLSDFGIDASKAVFSNDLADASATVGFRDPACTASNASQVQSTAHLIPTYGQTHQQQESFTHPRGRGPRRTTESPTPQPRPVKRPRLSSHTATPGAAANNDTNAEQEEESVEDSPDEGPLRHNCGEPGCGGYRSAEGPNWLRSIRAHYRKGHPKVKFDSSKLIATRGKRLCRAMSPI